MFALYVLAWRLGRTVAELGVMSAAEFDGWRAFFDIAMEGHGG